MTRSLTIAVVAFGAMPAGAEPHQIVADHPPPPPAAEPGPPITKPVWSRRANDDDRARYYPDTALAMKPKVEVSLGCSVSASGTLVSCQVVQASPAGVEFDVAALKISKLYKMSPVDGDGKPTYGRAYRLVVTFDPVLVAHPLPAGPLPLPMAPDR